MHRKHRIAFVVLLPVFGGCCPVALSPILEPVSHLRGRQSRRLGELPLFGGVRVRVLQVPLPQQVPRALLEAVSLLFAVPDRSRQRELLPHPVLVDRTERSTSQPLGLLVVGLEPHRLQLGVRVFGELVVLEDLVQVLEVTGVEGDEGARPQHRLVPVEGFARCRVDGQRPQEAAEAFYVAALLQRLAYLRHLLRCEVERRQRGQRVKHHLSVSVFLLLRLPRPFPALATTRSSPDTCPWTDTVAVCTTDEPRLGGIVVRGRSELAHLVDTVNTNTFHRRPSRRRYRWLVAGG